MSGKPHWNRSNQSSRREVLRRTLAGAAAAGLPWSYAIAQSGQRILTAGLPNNPPTFDPLNQSNHDAMVVTQLVFENLLEVDVDGGLQPQLAVALPKISDDRLTYWFDLRDNVRFQDGSRFTSADVKYSYEYILDPKNKALRRPLWSPINAIVPEGDFRVRFELSQPYRPWLQYMTKYMGIFPVGSREKYGDDHFKLRPIGVGTGPGIFVDAKPNEQIELRRNPDYWNKPLPQWDRVILKIIPDDSVRSAYLATRQLQLIGAPPPREFARLKAMSGLAGDLKPALGSLVFLQLNNARPPFDDRNFRRAVSASLDRQALSKQVFYGLVEPSAVPAPASAWWFNKEASDSIDYNPERAAAWLKQSKYPGGAEFELAIPSQPYLVDVRDAALVIQAQLAKLGIKVNIRAVEFGPLIGELVRGTHHAACVPFVSASDPTYNIDACYVPGKFAAKSSNYDNPVLTELLKSSLRAVTEEELKPTMLRIQAVLAEDCPHVWLGALKVANLWRTEVRKFKVNTGMTLRLREVELA